MVAATLEKSLSILSKAQQCYHMTQQFHLHTSKRSKSIFPHKNVYRSVHSSIISFYYWSIIALPVASFCWSKEVNQLCIYIYIYPFLSCAPPSHPPLHLPLGHQWAPSWAPRQYSRFPTCHPALGVMPVVLSHQPALLFPSCVGMSIFCVCILCSGPLVNHYHF